MHPPAPSRASRRSLGRGECSSFLHLNPDHRCAPQFAFPEAFPDREIVQTLSAQLSWSHFTAIVPLDDALKRDFYAEMCRLENWSYRTLRDKIGSMLYERTAISKKPDKLIKQELAALRSEDKLTPDLVFRDPYILDFLGLKDTYAEKDVEAAILREVESFILELGVGFAFLERQKRKAQVFASRPACVTLRA